MYDDEYYEEEHFDDYFEEEEDLIDGVGFAEPGAAVPFVPRHQIIPGISLARCAGVRMSLRLLT